MVIVVGATSVLELAVHEELEPHEISVVLGVSPVAARSRLSRARRRMAQVLDEPSSSDPPATGSTVRVERPHPSAAQHQEQS